MNLFNFAKYSNIENKTIDSEELFRLAQRKNGNFVLVNNSGKVVSNDFDWISKPTTQIPIKNYPIQVRLAEKNGILYFIEKDNEKVIETVMPRFSNENQNEDNKIYARPEENGITQIFIKQLNSEKKEPVTFFLNKNKEISPFYDKVTPENKNHLRIAWELMNGKVEIISNDGMESYLKFKSVSNPDENGVRIGEGMPYIAPVYEDAPGSVVYPVLFIPQNFNKEIKQYYSIEKFENNYKVTDLNSKMEIINKNGNNVSFGKYHDISEPNKLGEIIANRSKSKSNNGIILVHEGKRYKKVEDLYRVIDSAPIGIKAMKYGPELNKNVVAGVNISDGIEVDEDVNRVLIAMLKNEKPSPRFWKSIENNDKFNALFEGLSAYEIKLDEIAKEKPELAEEIQIKKDNLSKHLSSVLKRKIAGHKNYEKREDKKIQGHEQNISQSTNAREKLSDAYSNFEKN